MRILALLLAMVVVSAADAQTTRRSSPHRFATNARSFAISHDGRSVVLWEGVAGEVPSLFASGTYQHVDWEHYGNDWRRVPSDQRRIRWNTRNAHTRWWLSKRGVTQTQQGGNIAWNWSQPAEWHNAVVRVRGEYRNGGASAGSGVYVEWEGCAGVLTAAHVIQDSGTAVVTWQDGQQSAGRCTTDRFGHDIGWIQIQTTPSSVEPLPVGEAQIGQVEINGFGGPADQHRHFWAQLDEGPGGRPIAVSKVSATYGDSGGPWIQAGKVVGITSGVSGDSAREVPGPDGNNWILADMTHSADSAAIAEFCGRVIKSQFG